MPSSLAIISASFTREQRGRAIGTWSGFTAITAALGPLLGGWLVEHVSWRAGFFINVPMALVVLVLLVWHVPESRDRDAARLDWRGALLGTVALGALVYRLIPASTLGLTDGLVLVQRYGARLPLVVGLGAKRRAREPGGRGDPDRPAE